MGAAYTDDTNPYEIDLFLYLFNLPEKLSASDCLEHYRTLIPALLRLHAEAPARPGAGASRAKHPRTTTAPAPAATRSLLLGSKHARQVLKNHEGTRMEVKKVWNYR